MRRHRVALATGTVALVLAAGVAMLLGLFTPAGTNTPAGGSSPVGAAASPTTAPQTTGTPTTAQSTTAQPTAGPPNAAPAVPGTHGDGYVRNVTAGAACSPAGALGFTVDMKQVRCETTATDPNPRWRTL